MKGDIYNHILEAKARGEKLFALLVDPEKCDEARLEAYVEAINRWHPDMVLVGGSQLRGPMSDVVSRLKEGTDVPVVLFPGHATQFTPNADGILLLSLISGRNAEFLIGQQVAAARTLRESGMEVMPTGYVLIDGGKESAVEKVSGTKAMDGKEVEKIVDTAIAGEQMGMKLVYLEAGSGARCAVSEEVIGAVRGAVEIPLIVGGGIRTRRQVEGAYRAGADVVVVGNALEENPMKLGELLISK